MSTRTIHQPVNTTGAQPPIGLDEKNEVVNVGIFITDIDSVGLNYTVEVSPGNDYWHPMQDFENLTDSAVGHIAFPAESVRIVINALTSGNIKFSVVGP